MNASERGDEECARWRDGDERRATREIRGLIALLEQTFAREYNGKGEILLRHRVRHARVNDSLFRFHALYGPGRVSLKRGSHDNTSFTSRHITSIRGDGEKGGVTMVQKGYRKECAVMCVNTP